MGRVLVAVVSVFLTSLPVLAQSVADGSVHTVKISYQPGILQIFLDNLDTALLSIPLTIGNVVELNDGEAWIGFTSGTGTWLPTTDILNWSFSNGTSDFTYNDFSSIDGLTLAGATFRAGSRLRLLDFARPANRFETAAAWNSSPQPVATGFTTTFDFQIFPDNSGNPGAGGLAFVIQGAGESALGGCGFGLGYLRGDNFNGMCDFWGNPGSIPGALGIEIDTYENPQLPDWPPEYIDDGWFLGGIRVGGDHVAGISTKPIVFTDGFESGDTSAWSNSVP